MIEALKDAFVTDAANLVRGIHPLRHSQKLAPNFPQFRCEEILQNLADIFNGAHENSLAEFYTRLCGSIRRISRLYTPARPLPHWSVDSQTVVILDFGSQYTQLIARRIREQNVFSVVLPCTVPLAEIKALNPIGVILSGGPSSVYDADAPPADPKILDLGVPTLGICYGLQFIVHHLGGKVRSAPKREYGHAEVAVEDPDSQLFASLPASLQVWMSHGDEALELPAGFHRVAASANALAGIENADRRIWAVQFHP